MAQKGGTREHVFSPEEVCALHQKWVTFLGSQQVFASVSQCSCLSAPSLWLDEFVLVQLAASRVVWYENHDFAGLTVGSGS